MQQETAHRIKYILADFFSTGIGFFLFDLYRFKTLPGELTGADLYKFLTNISIIAEQCLVPLLAILLYSLFGSYNKGNTLYKSRLEETFTTLSVSLVAMLAVFFVALINDAIPERATNYELMLALFAALFVPTFIVRMLILRANAKLIRRGNYVIRTVVVGASQSNKSRLAKIMRSSTLNGLKIVAAIDTDNSLTCDELLGLPVYHNPNPAQVCAELKAKAVIILPSSKGLSETTTIINSLYSLNVPLFISPDLHSMLGMRPRVSQVIAEPVINITSAHITPAVYNFKRLGDIVTSALSLIILSPVFAAIAIAVKADSKGPAIYNQERIGLHKKPFRIYKFRTMYQNSEDNGPALSCQNDPRITKVGKFLRKYRLDELPQFWNVLKGDMSLVGPRPERDYYIQRITERMPAYSLIHQVRPGITSWGMVRYGYATTVNQMIERLSYDMLYLENVSLAVDLKILFHTVNTVFTGKGL